MKNKGLGKRIFRRFYAGRRPAGMAVIGILLAAVLLCTGCGGAGAGSKAEKPGEGGTGGAAESGSASSSGSAESASAEAAASSAGATTGEEAAAAGTGAAAGVPDRADAYKGLIVIDPGHQQDGNNEEEPVGPGAGETKAKVSSGTSGTASGVPEYQLTLDMGLKLRDELEDRGYRVIMTRETNEIDISNAERAAIANEAEADAFVRLHANGSGDGGAKGAMTICQTPQNPYNGDLYEKSRALSDCILDAYVLATGIRYEYVWETDSMSGINWSRVPVTILEMGYMSNREEDLSMQDPQMQEKMVGGIADGIDAYMVQHPREQAGKGFTGSEAAAEEGSMELSPPMQELKKRLEDEIGEKGGKWSMYLYRLDTGEEFGVNENDAMISASLIKLFIAGCYFDRIDKGVIADDYPNQLFTMLSESNNSSTNQLIDVLGMDAVNEFIRDQGFEASSLQRKMLEKNGHENYTSAKDCGRVLRMVYEGSYVSKEASERIMEAMKAQIDRNRHKIPAGVPEGVETANKTGELYTSDDQGRAVLVENDAAIIFQPDRPYVLTVMTTVPSAGEGEMMEQIASLSAETFQVVSREDSGAGGTDGAGEIISEGSTEAVSEDAAVSLPVPKEE